MTASQKTKAATSAPTVASRPVTDPRVDGRLTELEIKASFTEDLLEQLNLTIFRQQEQIDQLIREVAVLRQGGQDPNAGAARNPRDEVPPHY